MMKTQSMEDRVAELTEEVARLTRELEEAGQRERELEDTRRAMLYLLEDINESTENIEKAKREWEATFDSISAPLFIHDHEMKIVRCNEAYKAVAGLDFSDIVGRPYYEIFPVHKGPFPQCVDRIKGKKADEDSDVYLPHGDRVYKLKFYAIRDEDSDHEFSLHVMEDVTEARRAEEKDAALNEFNQRIASNLDISYRHRVVCETAVDLGYRMAWLGFYDEDLDDVVPAASAGREEGFLEAAGVGRGEAPAREMPCLRAVKDLKPVICHSITPGERIRWKEEALKRGFCSALSLPIMDGKKAQGVLTVYGTKEGFAPREVEFLNAFVGQAGVYLKNATLFKELRESAERVTSEVELTRNLLKIAESTAHTVDVNRLMTQVVECVVNITGCDACLSYAKDRDKGTLAPQEGAGLVHEAAPLFRINPLGLDVPFVARALDSGQPVYEQEDGGEALRSSGLARLVDGLNTVVAIPLKGREDDLGLLLCLYGGGAKSAPVFTDRDRQLLGGISHQVSVALEEARLYQDTTNKTMDLSRKIETIQIMHEIDRSILSTLEPSEILETAAIMVGRLVQCDRATIALVDREKKGFIYAAGFGLRALKKGDVVRFEDTSAHGLVKTMRPQYTPDLKDSGELKPLERKLLSEGFLSQLRVPLIVKGAVIGVLSIGSRRLAAYSPDDLSILEKLASQISVAYENSRLLSDREELFLGVVRTLSEAIDAKSPWTRGHSDRVTTIAVEIGREMGFAEEKLKVIELAGLLHDIGKLGTYESILDKPGALTREEQDLMKLHPAKGADILAPIRQMSEIVPAIRHHHEFYDGSGYPDGLAGEEIPLMARILAVADTVDAMSADRPYRKGRPMEVIRAELKRCSGTQFDPLVVSAFLRTTVCKAA